MKMKNKREIWIVYLVLSKKYNQSDFYAVAENEYTIVNGKKYILYGFTPEKEIFKRFKESRDMRLFKVKHITDKEEALNMRVELCDMHTDLILDFHDYETIDVVNGIVQSKSIEVVCTEREYISCMEASELCISDMVDIITDRIHMSKCVNYESLDRAIQSFEGIFKREIYEALEDLDFRSIIEVYNGISDVGLDAVHGYNIDYLELFCNLYGNTFNKSIR